MFCIAAFIIFAILGLFSATYRPLVAKAWSCVLHRVTFRPCDINAQQELKGKVLGMLMKKTPWLARIAYKHGELLAGIFVVLSVWSVLAVGNTVLNLYVYDTCNPNNVQSCSLGGQACGIDTTHVTLIDAVKTGKLGEYILNPFKTFANTISRIPDRLKHWEPRQYIPSFATYRSVYDENKPTALEIVDPGCRFCAQLLRNIKDASFDQHYNLTYIAYPIPSTKYENGYKFANSYRITQYLEALRVKSKMSNGMPADWVLLEMILIGKDHDGVLWQEKFNTLYSDHDAEDTLVHLIGTLGYSQQEQDEIRTLAHSQEIIQRIQDNRILVEEKIRTIKIPTIMFGGRRYDRLIDTKTLR